MRRHLLVEFEKLAPGREVILNVDCIQSVDYDRNRRRLVVNMVTHNLRYEFSGNAAAILYADIKREIVKMAAEEKK